MAQNSASTSYISPGQGGYSGGGGGGVAPGSSSSSGFPIQTPENDIMNQISGVASGYANQLMNWAQGVFAKTSAITDQAVGNFFQVSQQMQGLSQSMISQYNNLFAPENKLLVQDANSYDSPARVAADMGMAGATAAQAGDAAEKNSVAQLQQYGIDPSSGRYAGLINADNVQNAANVAGEENKQRVADTQMGQTLRAEAVQTGAQLPSSIANAENTGIQANTGAENAELANANTGANMFSVPNNYLGTAMGIKMPFSGSQSQSQQFPPSISGGSGGGSRQGGGGSDGGGMGGGGGGSGNGAPSAYQAGAMGGAGSPYGGAPGMQTTNFPGQPGSGPQPPPPPGGGNADPNNIFPQDPWNQDTMVNPGITPQTDPSQTFGGAGGGNSGWDPNANQASLPGGWQDPTTFDSNPGGFGDPAQTTLGGFDPTQGGGGINDFSSQVSYSQPPPSAPPEQVPSQDPSSWGDPSGDNTYSGGDSSGGDSSFARGGPVPQRMRTPPKFQMPNMMASGGQVPAQASPSGGQQVDDVRAQGPGKAPMRLNANEFVIPQDVALWKGQEFFQNMINQSRKARMGAPAKPTSKPMGVQ